MADQERDRLAEPDVEGHRFAENEEAESEEEKERLAEPDVEGHRLAPRIAPGRMDV